MTDHYNTGSGQPQTKDEVRRMTDSQLRDFMAYCSEEPADFDNCLACYAYWELQEREQEAKNVRRLLGASEDPYVILRNGVHA